VGGFLETNMFKKYLLEIIYSNKDDYAWFNDLNKIPRDLLVDLKPIAKVPVEHLEEFEKLINASGLMKKNFAWSNQISIQSSVEDYYFKNSEQENLLEAINTAMKTGIDMIPYEIVIDLGKDLGFDKEKCESIIEGLERKGELFKPRKNFYKTISHAPSGWFE
ncbi:MAG: hypothetical protein WCW13_06970, partial [archaeon]